MVTLTTADRVLKTLYLDVICDQLNNKTNPFYAAIKKGSEEIAGKNISAICRYGVNGGVGSAREDGALPKSSGNSYLILNADLKNIYGTIEISDKALRASRNSSTTLVNLLNAEMEGLLEAAKFNFARMLWQNGSGELAKIGDMTGYVAKNVLPVTSTRNFVEGMIVDICNEDNSDPTSTSHRIIKVDRTKNEIFITPGVAAAVEVEEGEVVTLQQSFYEEIYGLPYLFDSQMIYFYGVSKTMLEPILPHNLTINANLSTDAMQELMDIIEGRSGNETNMLLTSYAVRRKYLTYLQTTRTNIDYLNLDGGFKALSYNGIPLIADKFCGEDAIFYINTNDYKLVELCDWQWLEGESGGVLSQLEKTPAYTGTLVKYANLLCTRPYGQGRLNGIT
ncbi:MAG: phage major capsid protein [Clostridia bacterium]